MFRSSTSGIPRAASTLVPEASAATPRAPSFSWVDPLLKIRDGACLFHCGLSAACRRRSSIRSPAEGVASSVTPGRVEVSLTYWTRRCPYPPSGRRVRGSVFPRFWFRCILYHRAGAAARRCPVGPQARGAAGNPARGWARTRAVDPGTFVQPRFLFEEPEVRLRMLLTPARVRSHPRDEVAPASESPAAQRRLWP